MRQTKKIRIQPPDQFAAVVAAIISILFVASAHDLGAQSSSEYAQGLTGDPLVDSILQAPGPRYQRDRDTIRREMWQRRAPSDDERDIFEDDPLPRAEEPRWRRRSPAETRDPAEPPRFSRRPPPPLPVKRGEPPVDIAILDPEPDDTETESETTDPQDFPKAPVAAVEPEDLQSETDQTLATREAPYRESADPQTAEARPEPVTPDTSRQSKAVNPELAKMVGQMVLVGFRGKKPSDEGVRTVAMQIKAGTVGGVILMGHNVDSPDQVKGLTSYLREAGEEQPTPFIAIDQEGGYVQRLSRTKGFQTHPSAARLGARNDPRSAYSAYRRLALELRAHGINLNLGPVVDLNINPDNPIIGRLKRSYGVKPEHVSAFAKAFIFAHNETGILTAAKHFPGHGSSETDSHDQLVDISDSWTEKELRPYRQLIEAQVVDIIMVGHLYHPSFSADRNTPASLSRKSITEVLRDSLNYDGVVMTDDLDMRGVREATDFEERIVASVAAGNDILLITNTRRYTPDLPKKIAAVLQEAINREQLSLDRIRKSYQRVLALKNKLSRLQRTATSQGEDRGLDDHSGG